MSNLSGLIEYVHPIDPTSLCGTVLDRILDMPGCDLLAVVKQGRPVGVIARGAVRAQNAGLRVSEVMTPALTVGAEMSVDELVKQVPKLMKASSPAEIQRLVRNALPGISLRHVPVPPSAIPVKLTRHYFALNQSGVLWEGIVKSQRASIFVPDEIAKPELELLIVMLD